MTLGVSARKTSGACSLTSRLANFRNFNVTALIVPALLCVLSLTVPAFAQDAQTDSAAPQLAPNRIERIAPEIPTTLKSVHAENDGAAGRALQNLGIQNSNMQNDFDNNTPTGWYVYVGQTPTQVSSTVSTNNARIVDLQVATVSPLTFNATYVSNTGSYAKGWWWYYGATVAQVSSAITTNNARLISVKAYDIGGGQIRYAAVMISNTGADAKGWWWYVGESVSGISSLVSTNNARLVAVDPYVTGGSTYYTAIMISNTGTDAAGWWWYVNASPASISNAITNNNARIIYMNSAGSGNFNVIMESCTGGCSEWWWYYGLTPVQALNTALQNGARLITAEAYPGCGGSCFAALMINNSNEVTQRVGNILRNGIGGGVQGLYLKQVGGPVLGALEDNQPFEPASTIKVVANLYAMNRVQHYGYAAINNQITHYTNGPESCPNPPVVSGTETIALALREMMWHSDNTRTREITDHFTDSAINSYAHSIGMTNTGINHYIGCGGPTPDTLTLDDAGKLYEGVANQTLLNAESRGIFYSNMAGRAQYQSEGYDWTGLWSTDIPNMINQVAPASYTTAQKAAYFAAMNLAYKAGGYTLCQNNSCTSVVEDISIAGWVELPVCVSGGTTYSQYVFGTYLYNAPDTSWFSGKTTTADTNFSASKSEVLREQIQAGMASCVGKTLRTVTWTPSNLVFPTTTVGQSAATESITFSNNTAYAVGGVSVSSFGDFAQTNNCPTSLSANKSCTITVTFHPTVTGERTGAVIVTDNAHGQPHNIEMTGAGQ